MTGSEMRSFGLVAIVASVLIVGCVPFLMSEDADAASSDSEWRDPPSADYVIDITQDLSFKSNDPEYTLVFDAMKDSYGSSNLSVSGSSKNDLTAFYDAVYSYHHPDSGVTWSNSVVIDDETTDGWSDACVPSWINASIFIDENVDDSGAGTVTAIDGLGFKLTIMPALQDVDYDTHGEYWIFYSFTTTTDYWVGSDNRSTETFLFTFSVDVEWNGGVIVPDSYNQFIACIDWGNGYVQELTPVTLSSEVLSASFSVPEPPVRDGLVFKGISQSSGGSVISGDLIVSVGGSNVVSSDSGDGGTVYTGTFFAVWEEERIYLPTMWDELASLLSDPLVVMLLIAGFLSVCLFIRSRTGGR